MWQQDLPARKHLLLLLLLLLQVVLPHDEMLQEVEVVAVVIKTVNACVGKTNLVRPMKWDSAQECLASHCAVLLSQGLRTCANLALIVAVIRTTYSLSWHPDPLTWRRYALSSPRAGGVRLASLAVGLALTQTWQRALNVCAQTQ